mmetsp:Transcript_31778/g.95144  ORF Transcript_31778/g.95144 Transcript_31778/m.95144 type:complete len:268 (-) Transcript_31778:197-1000(-)
MEAEDSSELRSPRYEGIPLSVLKNTTIICTISANAAAIGKAESIINAAISAPPPDASASEATPIPPSSLPRGANRADAPAIHPARWEAVTPNAVMASPDRPMFPAPTRKVSIATPAYPREARMRHIRYESTRTRSTVENVSSPDGASPPPNARRDERVDAEAIHLVDISLPIIACRGSAQSTLWVGVNARHCFPGFAKPAVWSPGTSYLLHKNVASITAPDICSDMQADNNIAKITLCPSLLMVVDTYVGLSIRSDVLNIKNIDTGA